MTVLRMVLASAVAVTASACSGSSSESVDQFSVRDGVTSLRPSVGDEVALTLRQETLIASCMGAVGFDYRTPSADTLGALIAARNEQERVAGFPVGRAESDQRRSEAPSDIDPNSEVLARLSPNEYSRYVVALIGDGSTKITFRGFDDSTVEVSTEVPPV
jgi:hypothetical protein